MWSAVCCVMLGPSRFGVSQVCDAWSAAQSGLELRLLLELVEDVADDGSDLVGKVISSSLSSGCTLPLLWSSKKSLSVFLDIGSV